VRCKYYGHRCTTRHNWLRRSRIKLEGCASNA
jgi:hypothetical protein